jgi:recombinational DNA repair protein RecT
MWDENGKSFYRWKPALDGQGEFRGVVSVVVTKAGWRCDWMNREEVYKIRARSSYYAVKKAGPWVTDEIEMAKKTGVKRIMKLYQDDPALTRLMEIDDLEYEVEPEAPEIPSPPVGKFTPKNGRRKQDAPPAADQELKQETTKETFVGAKPETCKAIREHFVLSGEPPSETLKNFPGKECWEDLTEDEACDVLAALRGVENG